MSDVDAAASAVAAARGRLDRAKRELADAELELEARIRERKSALEARVDSYPTPGHECSGWCTVSSKPALEFGYAKIVIDEAGEATAYDEDGEAVFTVSQPTIKAMLHASLDMSPDDEQEPDPE